MCGITIYISIFPHPSETSHHWFNSILNLSLILYIETLIRQNEEEKAYDI